ncbi:MAG: COG4315 family predicted lipoprotein [Candidatus Saccharimonadales bacterium]
MKKAIIIIVALIILGGGGYLIFHKSDNTNNSSTSGSNSTPTSTPTSNSSSGSAVIKTASDSSVGQYLADGSGKPLYTYGADTSGVSNCSGSCLSSWPAYAPGPTTSLPANVTIIKRSDGSSQYAYKGLPLYYFTSDSAGQVSGDGVSNFHVAKP